MFEGCAVSGSVSAAIQAKRLSSAHKGLFTHFVVLTLAQ